MSPTQLPLPLFACPACGAQEIPRFESGTGPQVAKAVCARCGTFLRWVPRRLVKPFAGKDQRMGSSVNRTILLGAIGRYGVEVRYANSGAPLASFTLVCSEQWQDGTMHELYIPCEIAGKRAEAASEVAAGTLVLFEGKLAKRKKGEQWELLVSGFELTPVLPPVSTASQERKEEDHEHTPPRPYRASRGPHAGGLQASLPCAALSSVPGL
jgi:primosomal replication protein N